jgi:hypothetical protein
MKQLSHETATRIGRCARRHRAELLGFSALGLIWAALAPAQALAADAAPASSPAATDATANEVVINGVPYRETVLPTRLKNESTYGIDLSVMETPRNTTLLSTTQLETLNIDDPRAFSYLTSSSYTDAAFGTPNIPRVRGQYADVFYNGMRDSLTQNGYGVPVNYDAFANISITKGPANTIDGPGPGSGGEVDFLTKRPNLDHMTGLADVTLDTVNNRRLGLDLSMPLIKDELAVMLSYSGEDSGSYFYGHWMHRNALYGALRWAPTDSYTLDFNAEANIGQYTEEVGVNRANQALINNGTYLTGEAAPGDIYGYETFFDLTGSIKLNPRITLDETPGTTTRAQLYNWQLIQKYKLNSNLTIENNTLFMFQNSDNHEWYYYADESNGSYTIENKTQLNGDYDLNLLGSTVRDQFVVGGTFRYAYTNYISNFNNEAVSVWDLSTAPITWRLDPGQQTYGDAVPYTSVFGTPLYGVLGRDYTGGGNTGVSELYDTGLFFQNRMTLTEKLSVLFGLRLDVLQDHTHDPLDCSPDGIYTCEDYYPQNYTTGAYGDGQANLSALYKFTEHASGYVTFDWTQAPPNPNGGEGGINAYGMVPDSKLLRGNSFLYEAGAKFDLLDKRLFISAAVFDQIHQVPTGPGDTESIGANTRGVELEGNYQPSRDLYVTASYSFIKSTLDSAPEFYDFPAQLGANLDGAGTLVSYLPGKVDQPDQPQHLFNVLANYKFENGFGLRTGLQVTGPISLTASGLMDLSGLAGTGYFPTASVTPGPNGDYYYHSPVIPWQYTWNLAAFYEWKKYTVTLSVYNVTDRMNWSPSPSLYGNDFLVRADPRTYELRLQYKF